MRNVPKLRFKEFSEEWKEKKFKDLVLLQRGSSPRPIVKYITTSLDGVNWIKIGDTNKENRFITSTSEKITKEGAKKSREVKKGEIILSNSMSYGRPFILKIDGYIHDGWFVLRNYEENLNKEFLCQLLGSEIVQKQYKKLAAGGVVENISSELVNAIIINLPNLEEQEKIADFLSSIDKKISITEEKLDLFKDYKKGIIQKIFNQELRFKDSKGNNYPEWELVTTKEVSKITMGFTPSTKDESMWNGKYKWLSIADLKENGKYIHKTSKTITDKGIKNKKILKKGTLIMSFKLTLGRLGIISEEMFTNEAICHFNWNDKNSIDTEYVYYYLNSIDISNFGKQAVKGITLNTESLNSIEINLPCLEEQQKIADFLSSIDNKIDNLTSELENLKEFKKGLLQQMFV